jgi:hypothetical protein
MLTLSFLLSLRIADLSTSRETIIITKLNQIEAEAQLSNRPTSLNFSSDKEAEIVRKHLNIPGSYYPAAAAVAFVNIGELSIDGPSEIMLGEAKDYEVTLVLDSPITGKSFYAGDYEISAIVQTALFGIDMEVTPETKNDLLGGSVLTYTWGFSVKPTKGGDGQTLRAHALAPTVDAVGGVETGIGVTSGHGQG